MKKTIATVLIVSLAAGVVLAARGRQEGRPHLPRPSKEHEWLKNLEGTWEFTASFYGGPAPMESKGVQVDRVGCGGLWLIIDARENKEVSPFHGHGMLGYDAQKKKYIFTWVDDHSATFQRAEGTVDEAGKVMTMEMEATGPDGKPMKVTQIWTIKDKDHKSLKFVAPGPDGKEKTVGEIEYTR